MRRGQGIRQLTSNASVTKYVSAMSDLGNVWPGLNRVGCVRNMDEVGGVNSTVSPTDLRTKGNLSLRTFKC